METQNGKWNMNTSIGVFIVVKSTKSGLYYPVIFEQTEKIEWKCFAAKVDGYSTMQKAKKCMDAELWQIVTDWKLEPHFYLLEIFEWDECNDLHILSMKFTNKQQINFRPWQK
jgi:hypothetical protein